jgi:hypothetical protein
MVTAFKKPNGETVYCAPFCGNIIPKDVIDGKTAYSTVRDTIPNSESYDFSHGSTCIGSGYIHTYKNHVHTIPTPYQQIYECIIPEGTRYYEGGTSAFRQERESYASTKIIFKKRIKVRLSKERHNFGIPCCTLGITQGNVGQYTIPGKTLGFTPVVDDFLEINKKGVFL